MLLEQAKGGNFVDEEILRWHFRERLTSLAESKAPLSFGRIDPEDGDTHYIGRRHVRDEKGEPVVVDWRAKVAAAFYRATIQDPMGLERRRRFVLEGKTLVDLFDEYLNDPESMAEGSHGGVPDPLLAELNRARTGQMRDIVATIQTEQDRIIRADAERFIIVQGGPGTGKTAVGLHRAAFLLYEHREILERQKVLIVGPNQLFLEYIAQVLPSLGETAVYQTTTEGLAGGVVRARASDPAPVARLKGDVRMSDVLDRACWAHLKEADGDYRGLISGVVLTLDKTELDRLLRINREKAPTYRDGRERFVESVKRYIMREHSDALDRLSADALEVIEAALKRSDLAKVVNKMWPTVGATSLVRRVLTSPATLKRASDGLLSDEERRVLQNRSSRELREDGWSKDDLVLIDEADSIINGTTRRFGHTIVDEAQDLSAMEFRMIYRRTQGRSITVLGDLAQATSPSAQTHWEDVLVQMGEPEGAEIMELSLGYRVPAVILDFANRLLPEAAPNVTPARSVRLSGDPPHIIRSTEGFLLQDVEEEVREQSKLWQSVGLICPEILIDRLGRSLDETEIRYGTPDHRGLDEVVTLLPPVAAKGLEFDAVVVVEPALMMEEAQGPRRLYVSLTRAVQSLSIVHQRDLPIALRSEVPA
ncbi:MAG: hypothetical protein QOK47_1286 [Actinomycetota bacterium]|nr:hypothetical protein [Actinomycetota bacterium]